MAKTVNAELTYLESNQYNAELTINNNLKILDVLSNIVVINSTTTTPPTGVNGNAYIVGSGATGAWATRDKDIAYYYDGWLFLEPKIGWHVFNRATNTIQYWNGLNWLEVSTSASFNDTNFEVYKTADSTSKVKFSATNIPTSTTITITLPNGNYNLCKQNLSAAIAPTSSDDAGDGYSVGSMWIDTAADNVYICVDSTVGSSVWKLL
jgi:hypothetical protein